VLGAADQIPWTLGYPPKYGDEPGLSTLVKFDQAVYDWGDVGIGNPDQLGPAAYALRQAPGPQLTCPHKPRA